MAHPFRRYCIELSIRLGYTVGELLEKVDSQGLAEYIAYDRTNDETWAAKYQSSNKSEEDMAEDIKKFFGIK